MVKQIKLIFKKIIFAGVLSFFVFGNFAGGKIFSQTVKSDDRARLLIVEAMKARDAGKIGLARLYFLQARKVYPTIPKPVWLSNYPDPGTKEEERELFFRLCDSFPEFDCEYLLRERLKMDPGNSRIRGRLLKIARRKNDKKEILRHSSILENRQKLYWSWFKRSVAVVIYLLIAYNLLLIFRKDTAVPNNNNPDD